MAIIEPFLDGQQNGKRTWMATQSLTDYMSTQFMSTTLVYIRHTWIKNPRAGSIEENILPNLTGHVLKGEDKINLRTQSLFVIDDKFLSEFNDIDQLLANQKNHTYTFFHLGSNLSGHPDIVHGGLLATLLDELSCRLAFQNAKSKKGFTANLNINYYKPCKTGSYIMVKCSVAKKSGRKCWVRGEVFQLRLEDENFDIQSVESNENLLSGSDCLVIEPRPEISA
ncbi:hypothetical protein HF325_003375 [Metschnikowia pulcherrima]|uniref:Thioesterase domain-containing protein n=1 Tax=Metschnikowia pulcherrima TaxID=27326 RepID=A0A8H7GSQ6_9ASCO|nr:hypothetical protein HF325_003375 [Metschnikowia pulcherrima]